MTDRSVLTPDSSPGSVPGAEVMQSRDPESNPPETCAFDLMPASRIVVLSLIACLILAASAIWFEAELWAVPIGPVVMLGSFWWLLAAGAAFALIARFGGLEIVRPTTPAGAAPAASVPGHLDKISLVMLLISVGAEARSISLFWTGGAPTQAWLLHLFAVAQFVIATWGLY